MISFYERNFNELSLTMVHDMFALRSQIFVVEQKCVYQDIDGKDINAKHVIGVEKEKVIAYARILNFHLSNPTFVSIGRIIISKKERGKGYGHKLVDFCIGIINKRWPTKRIKISAQAHLKEFYEYHGFIKKGNEYLEDGIPHIEMNKKLKKI